MTNDPEFGLSIFKDKPLPEPLFGILASGLSGGVVSLPHQMFVCSLNDFRPSDADDFTGPARFRVGLCRSFMILSLNTPGLNFDVVWSPVIARHSGETIMKKPEDDAHPLFSFILADGQQIARSIRQATISPACALAMHRAQSEIMDRNVSQEDVFKEMQAVFNRYPASIPDGFFHETCQLGD